MKSELATVAGVASSIIAERSPKMPPSWSPAMGLRRIYCLYDEDAIDGADAKGGSRSASTPFLLCRSTMPCGRS